MKKNYEIDNLAAQVDKSPLSGTDKAHLSGLLQYAASINGSGDQVLQGLKKLACANVQQHLTMYELTGSLVRSHERKYHHRDKGSDGTAKPDDGQNPIARFVKNNPVISAITISAICGIVIGRWGLSAALILLSQLFGIGVSPVG